MSFPTFSPPLHLVTTELMEREERMMREVVVCALHSFPLSTISDGITTKEPRELGRLPHVIQGGKRAVNSDRPG